MKAGHTDFFIAGIGASAGGQQALGEFFLSLPPATGIAFCVITHLQRDHTSILDRILSRHTNMKVKRMKGLDLVRPDTIYVLPEGAKAYIKEGCIFLKDRRPDEIVNHTIDDFFLSLAEDQGEKAIGLIFSGMGDDGARGVKAISENGGIVLVQDPASTAFKSMPENAIRRDSPDEILPPALLARTILDHVRKKSIELQGR